MINNKSESVKSIVTAIIIVFFLLLISSVSDISHNSNSHSQNVLNSELQAGNAVIADATPLPSVRKFCLPLLSKLFSNYNTIFASDRKIFLSFLVLQKTQITIKPFVLCRFYYHIFSGDTEDLPILS
jgi:hypothetical protein